MKVLKMTKNDPGRLTDRLRELNKHMYGCVTVSADGYPCSDRGFGNWVFQHILPTGRLLDAQSLHYLNYLIAEPITAAIPYRNGVLVQIPRPERLAIHNRLLPIAGRMAPTA